MSSKVSEENNETKPIIKFESIPKKNFGATQEITGSTITYYPTRAFWLSRLLNKICYCFFKNNKVEADHSTGYTFLEPQPPECRGKKTLVLDLDETLVHSSFHYVNHADLKITVDFNEETIDIYVMKRPGVEEFLRKMSEFYEIVIFTASVSVYANPVIDYLDKENLVDYRLYRESCVNTEKGFIKDLSQLGRSLQDIIIIDNSPISYCFQPDNAVPINSWFDDPEDSDLYELIPVLESLSSVNDVTSVISYLRSQNLGFSTRNIEVLNSHKNHECENVCYTHEGRSSLNSPLNRSTRQKVFKFDTE